MKNVLIRKRTSFSYRIASVLICLTFIASLVTPPVTYAQTAQIILPPPGTMVAPSAAFTPPILRGIKVDPNNPLEFDLIVDSGDSGLKGDQLKGETEKFARYFLAALTIAEDDLWVNLSPYEKDRIISEKLGDTDLGRDLLAEDYILKQLASSLIHPESDLGKVFWDKVYAKAQELYGTTEVPINAFNRVWIVPDQAVVYEAPDGTAYVAVSHLKVMLEEDYMALNKDMADQAGSVHEKAKELSRVSSPVVREVIIPAIEKEVNEGKNFAQLRQINNAVVLAAWFKKALKESVLGQVYADKGKTAGVDLADPTAKDQIYDQYLQAFQKGAYNYIKQDYDAFTQRTIPRKYFSGGYAAKGLGQATSRVPNLAALPAPGRTTIANVEAKAGQGGIFSSRISLGQATPAGDNAFLGRRANTQQMSGLFNNARQSGIPVSMAALSTGTVVDVARLADEIVQATRVGHQAIALPLNVSPQQVAQARDLLGERDKALRSQFEGVKTNVNAALTQAFQTIADTSPSQLPAVQARLVDNLVSVATADTGIFVNPVRDNPAPVRELFTGIVNQAVQNPNQLGSAQLQQTLRTAAQRGLESYLPNFSNVPLMISAESPFAGDFAKAGVATGFQFVDTASSFLGPVAMPISQASQRIQDLRSSGYVAAFTTPDAGLIAPNKGAQDDYFILGTTKSNMTPLANVMQLAGKATVNPQQGISQLRQEFPVLAAQIDQVLALQSGSDFGFAEQVRIDMPGLGQNLQSVGDVWANSTQIESGLLPVSRDTRISVGDRQTTVGALLDAKPANFPQIQTAAQSLASTWNREAGVSNFRDTVSQAIRSSDGPFANKSPAAREAMDKSWIQSTDPLQTSLSLPEMQKLATDLGVNVSWNADLARMPQGQYQIDKKQGALNASLRAVEFAKSGAASVGIETEVPDAGIARDFARNVTANVPRAERISLAMGPRLSAGIPQSEMPEMAELGFTGLQLGADKAPRLEQPAVRSVADALSFQSPTMASAGITANPLIDVFGSVSRASTPVTTAEIRSDLNLPSARNLKPATDTLKALGVVRQSGDRFTLTTQAASRLPEIRQALAEIPAGGFTAEQKDQVAQKFAAMGLDVSQKDLGGINLDPSLMSLEIKRDGNGVPLPVNMQPIMNMNIQGFTPKVMNMQPVTNLPLTLSDAGKAKKTLAAK